MNPDATALKFDPSPDNLVLFCTMHLGVVQKTDDPKHLGRVKVLCPGLQAEGKKNWSEWIPLVSLRTGDDDKGDMGEWWSVQPGQNVFVFFPTGDPEVKAAIPGFPCADDEKPLIPSEPKALPRDKAWRVHVRKTAAGHTLIMDDNGQEELLALLDWTGAGLAMLCPGKKADEESNEDERTKRRKGEKRGTGAVLKGDAKRPSQVMKDGKHLMALTDLSGQGIYSTAEDGKGKVGLSAGQTAGGGPHVYMDAENDLLILGTSKAQIRIEGDRIFVTRQMIMETAYRQVKDFFAGVKDKFKQAFKRYEA
jgi:hypothetical protein